MREKKFSDVFGSGNAAVYLSLLNHNEFATGSLRLFYWKLADIFWLVTEFRLLIRLRPLSEPNFEESDPYSCSLNRGSGIRKLTFS